MPWWDDFPRLNVDNKRYGLLSEKEGEEGKKKKQICSLSWLQPLHSNLSWEQTQSPESASVYLWQQERQVGGEEAETRLSVFWYRPQQPPLESWMAGCPLVQRSVRRWRAETLKARQYEQRLLERVICLSGKKKQVMQMAISQAARKTVALSHETGQRIKKKNTRATAKNKQTKKSNP